MNGIKKLKYGACGANKNKPCWVYFFHLVPLVNVQESFLDIHCIKVGVTNAWTPHDRYKGINQEGIVRLYDVKGLPHIRLDWGDYPNANEYANEIEYKILTQWELGGGIINKRSPDQIDLLYSHKGNSEILFLKYWDDDVKRLSTIVKETLIAPQCTPPTDHPLTPTPKVPQTSQTLVS